VAAFHRWALTSGQEVVPLPGPIARSAAVRPPARASLPLWRAVRDRYGVGSAKVDTLWSGSHETDPDDALVDSSQGTQPASSTETNVARR
jgi:hypothetical protein